MESMTIRNDVPALADCDVELWTDCLGDYVSVWLRNSRRFIEDQQQKMLQVALCPFLFGVTHNLPESWLEILHSCGVIKMDREHKTTPLSEEELEMIDMAETIFLRCSQLVENKNDLKTILNFIYDVEERSALLGRIDMNYALQEVMDLEVFAGMWFPIKRLYERRKRQAQACIIYYFKIISQHVIHYGQNGLDKADYVKRILSELHLTSGSMNVPDIKGSFIEQDFRQALELYTSAIQREPLGGHLYSGRAAAYLGLCDYRSALCDSKRAIILCPKNSVNYFMAAKSHLKLQQFEKAEYLINQALECSTDPKQRQDMVLLSQEIQARSKMTKIRQTEGDEGEQGKDLDSMQVQYKRMLSEGSNFYQAGLYGRAMEHFKNALDIFTRMEAEDLSKEDGEQLVLWFVFGMSCVKTGNIRNLQAAQEKFHAIMSRIPSFPAAYYGLALTNVAFMRFKNAQDILKTGLEKIKECRDTTLYTWPETNKVIEETDVTIVQKLMEDLMKECEYPQKPDAICKFHSDTETFRKEIYVSDPDYKGHICLKCRAQCSIEFHPQCWKANDNHTKGKQNWKEMLDTPCPTPGCWGAIKDVYICRPDQEKSLKLSSQAEIKVRTHQTRPRLKMKTENPSKLEKKKERMKQKKEKRLEAKHKDQEEQLRSQDTEETQPQQYDQVADVNIDRKGTLLLKDEPGVLIEQKKQKAGRIKKKEKKQKQIINVDFQFKGDENKERYGIHSLDFDGDFVDSSPLLGLLPAPGSGTDRPQPFLPPTMNWVDTVLYDYFQRTLTTSGPMDLLGKEFEELLANLSEEQQTRLHEVGGLRNFLEVNPRFIISNNNIVSVIPGPLETYHRRTLGNPWDGRHTLGEATPLNYDYSLNPGAKEFIPQDVAADSSSGTHVKVEDELMVSCSTTAKQETNDLPAPGDGFTTVVNKKRSHNIHSVGQFKILRPVSSYHTVDEINLDSSLPRKSTHIENIDDINKVEKKNYENSVTDVRMDKLDDFRTNLPQKQPARGMTAAVPNFTPSSFIFNKTAHSSDASDVSADGLRRVSSPTLSENSGSSSGRADTNHLLSQPSSLHPLKAPAISLPTRARKKTPLGHISSKLYGHQNTASSDAWIDVYEDDSVSSTTSDRDSSCGDSRALHTDRFILTSTNTSSDKDKDSGYVAAVRVGGPSLKSPDSHLSKQIDGHSFSQREKRTSLSEKKVGDFGSLFSDNQAQSDKFFPSHASAFTLANQKQDIWSHGIKRDTLSENLSPLQKDLDENLKKIPENENVDFIAPTQPPIQRPRSQSQVSNIPADSEKSKTFEEKALPGMSWAPWDWNATNDYRKVDDGVVKDVNASLTDPWPEWHHNLATSSVQENVTRKGLLSPGLFSSSATGTACQSDDPLQAKYMDNNLFQNSRLIIDLGLSEGGMINQKDPWSTLQDGSSVPLSTKYENTSAFFPSFGTWKNVSETSATTNHSFYTSSAHSPQIKTDASDTVKEQLRATINDQSKQFENRHLAKNLQQDGWVDDDTIRLAKAKSKVSEVQTILSCQDIDQILARLSMLKEIQAEREILQQEKLKLQEAVTNYEAQLSHERLVTLKLSHDIKKLETRIQFAETSAEKWRDDTGQLHEKNELLKEQNKIQAEEVQKLNKQLEVARTTFCGAQMEILKLKTVVAQKTIDMKKQEAAHHLQRLANVISQAKAAAKNLPDSVYNKHVEFTSYIASCDSLKRQIEVKAHRLTEDLQNGMYVVDMSGIEDINLPAFPKPPSEAADKPQAPSRSEPIGKMYTKIQVSQADKSRSVSGASTASKSSSHQDMEDDDEDSKAYLSMIYGSSESSGSLSKEDIGACSDQDWCGNVDDRNKRSSFSISEPGSKLAFRSSSPVAAPALGALKGLPNAWGLSGQKKPKLQADLVKLTPNIQTEVPDSRAYVTPQVPGKLQSKQQLPYFERIVQTIQEKLPGYRRDDIQKMVDTLRRNSGGTLSGWSFESLANKILDMILDMQQEENPTSLADISASGKHLSSASSKSGSYSFLCSVCQSDANPLETVTLPCGHKFHDLCINRWFKNDRTCPNCRSHALLPEEFPSLK